MTGIVLALAGLTAGDGRPGTGAERATVAAGLEGEWEGPFLEMYRAELRGGVLRIVDKRKVYYSFTLRPAGPGAVTVIDEAGRTWRGIYRLDGRTLLVCWALPTSDPTPTRPRDGPGALLFTLRPAAPRKP
jgi:hypothetical protein